MARLYSYCLPYDNGSAPNPYGGVCTLVICKPQIRTGAQVGDWIAGTGARYARHADGRTRDMSGRLIYAMRVSRVLSLEAYDAFARTNLPEKIPRRVGDLGDAIYDYSRGAPTQRPGPHRLENMDRDLSGKNALLSDHFYYFGDRAIDLPQHLAPIAQNRQGIRVNVNAPFLESFVRWIEALGLASRAVVGSPLMGGARDSCTPASSCTPVPTRTC